MHYSKEQRDKQSKIISQATKSSVTQAEVLLIHDSIACMVNQLQILNVLITVHILVVAVLKISYRK